MAGLQHKQAALLLQATATLSKGLLKHNQPCAAAFLASKRNKSDLSAYKRGTGGRSSFNGVVATVFGASGSLGRYVVNQLGKMGSQVVVAYRGPEYDVEHLKLCGDLGQILFSPYYLRDEASVRKAMQYSNVVVNLVGRDWETKNFSYEDVHVTGAATIARIAAEQGVEKLIHLSCMNASNPQHTIFNKTSKFVTSKGQGEEAVRAEFPDAVIMRPSDIWGDEDRFFHYWSGHFRRHMGTLPVWRKGQETIKQPVDAVNVAQGIIKAITNKGTNGATFECVGPKSYYLSDMLEYFYDEMRYGDMTFMPIETPTFQLKAMVCERVFPATPPLVRDRLIKESASDILTGCPTLEDLGVQLNPMEDAARYQLKIRRKGKDYTESLHEVADALPPPTVAEVEESKKVYF